MLCCQQGQGAAALQDYAIQALSWEEVQGLAGRGIVGLPLGYTPTAGVVPPVLAVTPAAPQLLDGPIGTARTSLTDATQLLCSPSAGDCEGSAPHDGGHDVLAAVASQQVQTAVVAVATGDDAPTAVTAPEGRDSVFGRLSWHRVGWRRAQYVQEAVATANRMQ